MNLNTCRFTRTNKPLKGRMVKGFPFRFQGCGFTNAGFHKNCIYAMLPRIFKARFQFVKASVTDRMYPHPVFQRFFRKYVVTGRIKRGGECNSCTACTDDF